jgi:hypothetical protein
MLRKPADSGGAAKAVFATRSANLDLISPDFFLF